MPTIELDYDDLRSLLVKQYSAKDLWDKIPMLGVDLESIDQDKIVVEVFPNRPDLLSVEGFARALNGFLGDETGLTEYELTESGVTLNIDNSVDKVRPVISAAVIRNLTLNEKRLISLMNLQEKLHVTHGRHRKKVAIGVHDMREIEGPYTYKAVKPDGIKFKPLGMAEELTPKEILTKHPTGQEYAWILNGLSRYPIIVDKNNDILSFPPIINGELTRIRNSTTDVFIDVTGLDELAVNQALNIIVTSIADRGGDIQTVELVKL
ncbi:MAG: phenylalanine--tRNA ligase subunit beta [Candidatus Altiarchaeota archaeon]|nr:phenylalanine--tRNA ligase subunit beta [Candidatus Altiarchaeota archaeon]